MYQIRSKITTDGRAISQIYIEPDPRRHSRLHGYRARVGWRPIANETAEQLIEDGLAERYEEKQ